jgi:hypothetical protein
MRSLQRRSMSVGGIKGGGHPDTESGQRENKL